MRFLTSLALLGIIGCKPVEVIVTDNDGDGYSADNDCNDEDASIHPNASEFCNGIDNDCDGVVDNDLRSIYYADADGDGFGDANSTVEECVRPNGYVNSAGDCDDADVSAYPDNIELCDAIDHNCDGDPTAGATGGDIFWEDADGDGFGDPSTEVRQCAAPANFIPAGDAQHEDCDDSDANINPAAGELCATDYDDNCNGLVNESPTVDGNDYPVDLDGDGFGSVLFTACDVGILVDVSVPPDGLPDGVTVDLNHGADCDDDNDAINPGADEICDGLDNDCDVLTPEDSSAVDTQVWWIDADQDGAGSSLTSLTQCHAPVGYVSSSLVEDCDDADVHIGPDVGEYCDGIDNNCDGHVDEDGALDGTGYFIDVDGDGFGDFNGQGIRSCSTVPDRVPNNFDCDDTDVSIGAAPSQFLDHDGDGYGDPASETQGCLPILNYVSNALDCDDSDELLNPETVWYADADGDGVGTALVTTQSCEQPNHYQSLSGDCDDADNTVYEGAVDVCDGRDNDCDGDIDEDCTIEHCGVLGANEVWESGYIHLITCDVFVSGPDVVLTIQDGAEVRVDDGYGIHVGTQFGSTGTIIVQGGGSGVLFHSSNLDSPGVWGGVELGPYSGPSIPNQISHATFEHGGDGGYVLIARDSELLVDNVLIQSSVTRGIVGQGGLVDIQNTTVDGSVGIGIDLDSASMVVGFTGNTLTRNAAPLRLPIGYADALDTSTLYTGNTEDFVSLIGSDVTDDLTIPEIGVSYKVSGITTVEGGAAPVLDIEDDVELQFEADAALIIGAHAQGSIDIQSTTSVSLVGEQATPGYWDGITIGPSANDSTLSNVIITDGGGNGFANIDARGNSVAAIDERKLITLTNVTSTNSSHSGLRAEGVKLATANSTFSNNLESGAEIIDAVFLSSVVSGNTFAMNADSGVRISPHLVELLPGNTYNGNGLPIEILGGIVPSDATWELLDEPYYVTSVISVEDADGPVLELAPGTSFYFGPSGHIEVGVGDQGSLQVHGDTSNRVLFSSIAVWGGAAGEEGSYVGLTFGGNQQVSSLDSLTVEYAGSVSGKGSVSVLGSPINVLAFHDVTVQHSGTHGVFVDGPTVEVYDSSFLSNDDIGFNVESGGFRRFAGSPSFRNNQLVDNGLVGLSLPPDSVGQVAASTFFSGNNYLSSDDDYIEVHSGQVNFEQTWLNHGIDYRLTGGDLRIGGPAAPVLTLEPGIRFTVEPGGAYQILVGRDGETGGFIAAGTPAEPIVFTSASDLPTRGDWHGLEIGEECITNVPGKCVLDNIIVEYGGASDDLGALTFVLRNPFSQPDPVIFQNSIVRYSGTSGVLMYFVSTVVSPPPPVLPIEDIVFAYEDSNDDLSPVGENSNYCYDGNSFGDTVLVCDNTIHNMYARSDGSPYAVSFCVNDGPTACP